MTGGTREPTQHERDALLSALDQALDEYPSFDPPGPDYLADAVLLAGFRRVEVTPDMIEAASQAIHDQECSCNNAGFHGQETIAFRKESARAALSAALGEETP